MQIVTANRLVDGRVVFRDRTGGWVETLTAAAVLEPAEAAQALTAAADDVAAQVILDPYAVDVVTTPSGITPKTMREKIRAAGPSSGSEAAALEALARAA
jgi:hypothetical protein